MVGFSHLFCLNPSFVQCSDQRPSVVSPHPVSSSIVAFHVAHLLRKQNILPQFKIRAQDLKQRKAR